jgi:hypothetical protein
MAKIGAREKNLKGSQSNARLRATAAFAKKQAKKP